MPKTKNKNQEKKPNKSFTLLDSIEFDPKTQRCTDKIEIISLCHNTGHITLITEKDREIKIKLSDLISELKVEQETSIIKTKRNIFKNILKIKYVEKRNGEFQRLFEKAGITYLSTEKNPLGGHIAIVEVNDFGESLEEIMQKIEVAILQ